MTVKEMNDRQISFKGKSIYNAIPECESIITVVYADYDNIFLFSTDNLNDEEKKELVEVLIGEIQAGTNYTREIVKIIGNTYFVY